MPLLPPGVRVSQRIRVDAPRATWTVPFPLPAGSALLVEAAPSTTGQTEPAFTPVPANRYEVITTDRLRPQVVFDTAHIPAAMTWLRFSRQTTTTLPVRFADAAYGRGPALQAGFDHVEALIEELAAAQGFTAESPANAFTTARLDGAVLELDSPGAAPVRLTLPADLTRFSVPVSTILTGLVGDASNPQALYDNIRAGLARYNLLPAGVTGEQQARWDQAVDAVFDSQRGLNVNGWLDRLRRAGGILFTQADKSAITAAAAVDTSRFLTEVTLDSDLPPWLGLPLSMLPRMLGPLFVPTAQQLSPASQTWHDTTFRSLSVTITAGSHWRITVTPAGATAYDVLFLDGDTLLSAAVARALSGALPTGQGIAYRLTRRGQRTPVTLTLAVDTNGLLLASADSSTELTFAIDRLSPPHGTAGRTVAQALGEGTNLPMADVAFRTDAQGFLEGTIKPDRITAAMLKRTELSSILGTLGGVSAGALSTAITTNGTVVGLRADVDSLEEMEADLRLSRTLASLSLPVPQRNQWVDITGAVLPDVPSAHTDKAVVTFTVGTLTPHTMTVKDLLDITATSGGTPASEAGAAGTLTVLGDRYFFGRKADGQLTFAVDSGAGGSFNVTVALAKLDLARYIELDDSGNVDLEIVDGKLKADVVLGGGASELAPLTAVPDPSGYSVGDIVNVNGELWRLAPTTEALNEHHGIIGDRPGSEIGDNVFAWDDTTNSIDLYVPVSVVGTNPDPSIIVELEVPKHNLYAESGLTRRYRTALGGTTQDAAGDYWRYTRTDAPVSQPALESSNGWIGAPFIVTLWRNEGKTTRFSIRTSTSRFVLVTRATETGTAGLDTTAVNALIDPVARAGSTARWPKAKLPADVNYGTASGYVVGEQMRVINANRATDLARPAANTEVFATGTSLHALLKQDGDAFELLSDARGEWHIETDFTLTKPTSGWGVVQSPTGAADRMADVSHIEFASELLASTAFNGTTLTGRQVGERIATIPIYAAATKQGEVRVRLAREVVTAGNRSNYPGLEVGDVGVGVSVAFFHEAGSLALQWTLALRISWTPADAASAGGSAGISVKEDDTLEGAAGAVTTLDFTGDGVEVTVSGNEAEIAITRTLQSNRKDWPDRTATRLLLTSGKEETSTAIGILDLGVLRIRSSQGAAAAATSLILLFPATMEYGVPYLINNLSGREVRVYTLGDADATPTDINAWTPAGTYASVADQENIAVIRSANRFVRRMADVTGQAPGFAPDVLAVRRAGRNITVEQAMQHAGFELQWENAWQDNDQVVLPMAGLWSIVNWAFNRQIQVRGFNAGRRTLWLQGNGDKAIVNVTGSADCDLMTPLMRSGSVNVTAGSGTQSVTFSPRFAGSAAPVVTGSASTAAGAAAAAVTSITATGFSIARAATAYTYRYIAMRNA